MSLKASMQDYVKLKKLDHLEGDIETKISGIRFYRSEKGHPRKPALYKSGIIVIGQGRKNLYVGGDRIEYGEGDCLVMGVPMPVECEAIPSQQEPVLGLGIQIPLTMLQKLVGQIKQRVNTFEHSNSNTSSVRSGQIDQRLQRAFERLMQALCDDLEAEVLGLHLLEEVVFCTLLSSSGDTLFSLADQEGRYARIASVLEEIHTNYANTLNVAELASSASMSTSSFHTAFRNVTLESPIQYIKKVRLNKGRELICFEGKRVNDAANMVGYSSAAQFSREFKRQFNEAPKDAARLAS